MLQRAGFGHRIGECLLFASLLPLFQISNAYAQTTTFTYQGKLTDNGSPTNSNYDLQFKLFDSADFVTGNQVGSTIIKPAVVVTNGIFTVELDFGAGLFTGAARFLEIGVRLAGSPNAFSVLSPRQVVTSAPYAVRSASAANADNATQLGGSPPSGFIQNTSSQQASTNFNISGTGTANVLNAGIQFSLAGFRILSNGGSHNLFAGVGAGPSTTGCCNSFFGDQAGFSTTTGSSNSFFGTSAGFRNATGVQNSFFGLFSGSENTTGGSNSFFGNASGASNTTGQQNAFFGSSAGFGNTTGSLNSVFGQGAAQQNTTGQFNSSFGWFAGTNNQSGFANTFIGEESRFDSLNTAGSNNTLLGSNTTLPPELNNATAIGAFARVTQSNSMVLGSGVNVGIGTSAPIAKLQINTTALDQHLYLSKAAPSLALGDNDVRSSATRNAIFALSTAPGHFGVEAGGLMIATYGNDHGNIYVDSNYSGIGATNLILQPFIGNVAIGTNNPTLAKLQVETSTGTGVYSNTSNSFGAGVHGRYSGICCGGIGVLGVSDDGDGVRGNSANSFGVTGFSSEGTGVRGISIGGDLFVGQNPSGTRFRVANNGNVHAPAYQALPDFAEQILPSPADESRLEPGDVLVAAADVDRSVSRSRRPYSTSVLGVYSTAPGFIGVEHPLESSSSATIPMAVIGIVPCKVSAENGPIRRGDLLTTSSTPGHAMRCTDRRKCIGAIVGKALATLDRGTGVIKVLVTLQ